MALMALRRGRIGMDGGVGDVHGGVQNMRGSTWFTLCPRKVSVIAMVSFAFTFFP